ncbi:MAG: Spy/CpxP family protein refolding chaperone [Chromatiales bacterium]|nr:Spy/CpxP family protein refolding chaperone [Chromatiales bacterium]MDX9766383.1 Spy/CpxP family protein refolding chaperone [Ectothiorhodospiraceae bacterium]
MRVAGDQRRDGGFALHRWLTIGLLTLPLAAAAYVPGSGVHEPDREMSRPQRQGAPAMSHRHALSLSDAQQERLFAFLHAQAPGYRERTLEVLDAMDRMQRMTASGRADPATASALAATYDRAMVEMALMQTELGAQVRALLTPAQVRALDRYAALREEAVSRP